MGCEWGKESRFYSETLSIENQNIPASNYDHTRRHQFGGYHANKVTKMSDE